VASHFAVIVRSTSQLFVAGPPVVAAAMGEAPDKELGGADAQTRSAGAVDNEAADEEDAAFAQIRPLLPARQRVGAPPRRSCPPGRATIAGVLAEPEQDDHRERDGSREVTAGRCRQRRRQEPDTSWSGILGMSIRPRAGLPRHDEEARP
jgi:hypothetical protein